MSNSREHFDENFLELQASIQGIVNAVLAERKLLNRVNPSISWDDFEAMKSAVNDASKVMDLCHVFRAFNTSWVGGPDREGLLVSLKRQAETDVQVARFMDEMCIAVDSTIEDLKEAFSDSPTAISVADQKQVDSILGESGDNAILERAHVLSAARMNEEMKSIKFALRREIESYLRQLPEKNTEGSKKNQLRNALGRAGEAVQTASSARELADAVENLMQEFSAFVRGVDVSNGEKFDQVGKKERIEKKLIGGADGTAVKIRNHYKSSGVGGEKCLAEQLDKLQGIIKQEAKGPAV